MHPYDEEAEEVPLELALEAHEDGEGEGVPQKEYLPDQRTGE